jgi:peptide/nickel transport system substrate-binding protein
MKLNYSLRSAVTLAIVLVVALNGCSRPAEPTPPQATAPSQAAVPTSAPTAGPPTATPLPRGGNLTIRLDQDVPVLHPWQPRSRADEQVTGMLYSGLMRLDETLRPRPDLAERFEATADGRVLTFTLRTGLRWHDGQPLDANDVQFTLDQLRTLPPTSTALLSDLRYIADITTPTSTTVVLNLTERYAPLLAGLTLPILPRHLLQGRVLGELNLWDVPVGSGPFRLADRVEGQSIVLERFDGFYRGPPLLDRVAFIIAPDVEVTRTALGNEQLLMAELPWSTSQATIDSLSNLRAGSYAENGYYYLAFNLREGYPFADLNVRKALARAISLPRLVETATKGQGVPIGSSAAPGSWADLTPPDTTGGNLDEARAMLDAAGWVLPEGATVRQREGINLQGELFVRGDDERRVVAARAIAETAANIGMQITVTPGDFGTLILSKYAPPFSFDLLLGSWSNGPGDPAFADYLFYDPDDFALFHSSMINQGESDTRITRNFVAFSDPAYDNQSQAARQLYGIDDRIAAIRQTQARIAEQLPYFYLWADQIPVALNRKVTTLDGPVNLDTPIYWWNIERWYLQ